VCFVNASPGRPYNGGTVGRFLMDRIASHRMSKEEESGHHQYGGMHIIFHVCAVELLSVRLSFRFR
jgi:hypothetical protein